jgi:hypothetical protein
MTKEQLVNFPQKTNAEPEKVGSHRNSFLNLPSFPKMRNSSKIHLVELLYGILLLFLGL